MAPANTERDTRIVAAARLGQTHDAIAREHGISRARVSQIVADSRPRSPEEVQRQLIAERLRSRWDELEKIVKFPPVRTTSIGRTQFDVRTCTCTTGARTDRDHEQGCGVQPVLNMATVTNAIKTQLQIEQQYRKMFGVDLGVRPSPLLTEDQLLMKAKVEFAQAYLTQRAPMPALEPMPSGYADMTPEQQYRADIERRARQREALPALPAVPTPRHPRRNHRLTHDQMECAHSLGRAYGRA